MAGVLVDGHPMQLRVGLWAGIGFGEPGALDAARVVLVRRERHGEPRKRIAPCVFDHMAGAVLDACLLYTSRCV